MIFDDLTDANFLMFAMKEYNNQQCTNIDEFYDDLKKIKYIKRLINRFLESGKLKEILILNHLIVFYNVFDNKAATRLLFFKIEEKYWSVLKTFLIYLSESSLKLKMTVFSGSVLFLSKALNSKLLPAELVAIAV